MMETERIILRPWVISHGHSDYVGGQKHFIKINSIRNKKQILCNDDEENSNSNT